LVEKVQLCPNEGKADEATKIYGFCRKSLNIQAAIMICFIVVADQISKWAILEFIFRKGLVGAEVPISPEKPLGFMQWLIDAPERLPLYSLPVMPFLNFTMVWNDGVSFGLLSSDGDLGRFLLIAMACVISLFLGFLVLRTHSKLEALTMAAVIGGAIGNVIDRFRFGAVADFIDVHAFGYHFPVFNIADSAISVGILLLLVYSLFLSDEPTKENKDT
jgi:signal peptidase II